MAFAAAGLATAAPAAETGKDAPAVRALLDCRGVADDAERLRCFDRAAGAMDAAVQSRSVVVIDRAQLEQARRAEFGARRPPRGLPLPKGVDGGALDRVDGVVARAAQGGDGAWLVTLRDGSAWRQTDDTPLGSPPRAGEKATVLRASLGTFKLKVGKRPALRVRRVA